MVGGSPPVAEREGRCTLWASYLHTYSWQGILLWYILLFIISSKLSEIMRNYSNSSSNFKNLERYHWQCVKFCKKEFAKSISKSAWLAKRVLISRNCKNTYFIILSNIIFKKVNLGKRRTRSWWLILYRKIRPCKFSTRGDETLEDEAFNYYVPTYGGEEVHQDVNVGNREESHDNANVCINHFSIKYLVHKALAIVTRFFISVIKISVVSIVRTPLPHSPS